MEAGVAIMKLVRLVVVCGAVCLAILVGWLVFIRYRHPPPVLFLGWATDGIRVGNLTGPESFPVPSIPSQVEVLPAPDGTHAAMFTTDGLYILDFYGFTMNSVDNVLNARRIFLGWSPDSRWIIYLAITGDQRQLIQTNQDGSKTRPLSNFVGNSLAGWSPDGEWAYFVDSSTSGFFRAEINGIRSEQISDQPIPSDSSLLTVTRPDSSGYRNYASQNIRTFLTWLPPIAHSWNPLRLLGMAMVGGTSSLVWTKLTYRFMRKQPVI